jgi:nitroreductase
MAEIPNEIFELFRKNRSYRKFLQQPVPDETLLKQLVDLTRFAASSKNLQPLKYLLVLGKEELDFTFDQLKWAWYLKNWEGPAPDEHPTAYLIVLLDKNLNEQAEFDAGIAAQTILLGATAAGFGGCIIRTVNRYALSKYFELDAKLDIIMVIALGKPNQTVELEDLKPDGSIAYYSDESGNHIVPKRVLDDIIWPKKRKNHD